MNWLVFVAIVLAIGLCLVGLTIVIHLVFALRNRVPYVSTPGELIPEIVAALKLPQHGTVVDLGCGNGCVLEAVRRAQPGARLMGVENNPVPLMAARMKLGGSARLVWGPILNTELKEANRVFIYLGSELMQRLEGKFERELPAGARVVALQFPLPHRKPIQEIVPKNGKPFASRIFIYEY